MNELVTTQKFFEIYTGIRMIIGGGMLDETIDITEVPEILRTIAELYEEEIKNETD